MKFLADANVGRLARWLRAYGYDCEYAPDVADSVLVGRALAEGRTLLTRDAGIMVRRSIRSGSVRAMLLRSDSHVEQLHQVVEELGLTAGPPRCIECNVELESRTPETVAPRVPPYVRSTQTRYLECPRCTRIYWEGTHWKRMQETLLRAAS